MTKDSSTQVSIKPSESCIYKLYFWEKITTKTMYFYKCRVVQGKTLFLSPHKAKVPLKKLETKSHPSNSSHLYRNQRELFGRVKT